MTAKKSFISKWFLALHAMLLMLICSASSYSSGIAFDEHILTTDTIANQASAIPDTVAGVGEVFTEVEVMPDFPYKSMHGAEAFGAYIIDNFICPPEANESSFQGRYYVSFIVEVDGHISTIIQLRLIDPIIDKEVLRVISTAPKWIPGEHKGKKVRTAYSISVLIKF